MLKITTPKNRRIWVNHILFGSIGFAKWTKLEIFKVHVHKRHSSLKSSNENKCIRIYGGLLLSKTYSSHQISITSNMPVFSM